MPSYPLPVRRGGAEEESALGVLFVHGIGAQARGQTLAEFGGPVFRWLEDRFRGLGRRWRHAGLPEAELQAFEERLERWRWAGEEPTAEAGGRSADVVATVGTNVVAARAVLSDTRLTDPEDPTAPAHAKLEVLRLRCAGAPDRERWLLAESWWAESFAPPRFSDFARWGLGIVPWTFGAHFGARVRRRWAERPRLAAQENLDDRRRWRVGLGRAVGWIGALSLVFALARTWSECLLFARRSAGRALAWAAGLVGLDVAPPPAVDVAWKAVGLLALPLVAWWIVRKLWTRWDDADMRAVVQRLVGADSRNVGVLVGMWFQAIVAVSLATGGRDETPWWILLLLGLAILLVPILNEPSLPAAQRAPAGATTSDRRLSRGERTSKRLWRLSSELIALVVIAFWAWKCSSWILHRLAVESSLGPLREWIPLALGALVGAAWAVLAWRKRPSRSRQEPPARSRDPES